MTLSLASRTRERRERVGEEQGQMGVILCVCPPLLPAKDDLQSAVLAASLGSTVSLWGDR